MADPLSRYETCIKENNFVFVVCKSWWPSQAGCQTNNILILQFTAAIGVLFVWLI